MAGRTFNHKEENNNHHWFSTFLVTLNFKAVKDRRSLVWGQCYWLPMKTPRPSSISVNTRCVSYRSSKKSWMTRLLFRDAVQNCHASEMKCCLENNTSFKILLLDIPVLLVIVITLLIFYSSLQILPLWPNQWIRSYTSFAKTYCCNWRHWCNPEKITSLTA